MQEEHECLKGMPLKHFRLKLAQRRYETGTHDKLSIFKFRDSQKPGELKPAQANSLIIEFAEKPAVKAMGIYLVDRLDSMPQTENVEHRQDIGAVTRMLQFIV